jgi:hypothetical protein
MTENELGPTFEVENISLLLNLGMRLALGSAGLSIYKDFKIKTPELGSLVKFCNSVQKISLVRYPMPFYTDESRRKVLQDSIDAEYSSILERRYGLNRDDIPVTIIKDVKKSVDIIYELVSDLAEESQASLQRYLEARITHQV